MKTALWLLCGSLTALACGSLDQPTWTGQQLVDGVSPYRKVADLQFCVATAKLVQVVPGNGDLGLCRLESATPRTCSSDGECAGREGCVCGRCTVKMCVDSSECSRAGETCTGFPSRCTRECVTDGDCPGGACHAGACDAECSSDSACQYGEQCKSGHCVTVACSPATACQVGTTCDPQLQAGTVHAPAALVQDGKPVLYVEVLDTTQFVTTIYRTESADETHFRALPTTPVVPSPGDGSRVGAPAVVDTGAGVDLYYELGVGAGIHRLHSVDGKTFSGDELVLEPSATGWEAGSVGSPGVLALNGAVLLYYAGGAGAGIGLARSEGGGPFTRIGDGPLIVPRGAQGAAWSAIDAVGAPAPIAVTDSNGARRVRLFFSGLGREVGEPGADGGPGPRNYSVGVAIAPASAPTALQAPAFNPVLSDIDHLHSASEDEPSVVRVGGEWRMYGELKPIPELLAQGVVQPVGLAFASNPPRPFTRTPSRAP